MFWINTYSFVYAANNAVRTHYHSATTLHYCIFVRHKTIACNVPKLEQAASVYTCQRQRLCRSQPLIQKKRTIIAQKPPKKLTENPPKFLTDCASAS